MRPNDKTALELLNSLAPRKGQAAPADKNSQKSMQELLETRDPKVRAKEERVIQLRDAELAGDLAWMEYNSWLSPGNLFQRTLRSLVDPLFWGSAYFEKSKFCEHLPALIETLYEDNCGVILLAEKSYQVIIYSDSVHKWENTHVGQRAFQRGAKKVASFNRTGIKTWPEK